MDPASQSPFDYDVVIIGGAFSGASAAILLKRDRPETRVLVVEKQERFDEKVGEATTEMSGMFLTRRLAMWHHLEAEHLPKEGLRYWFHNDEVTGHVDASETGGQVRSPVPSFQLRRDVLDEYLLETARAEGAEIVRPARVSDVQLGNFDHLVTVEAGGETRRVRCRWVLDGTGRASWLGRRLGLIEKNPDHPIASTWARWRGVRHIDDLAARGSVPLARKNFGSRRLATNHYMGFGHWIWVIPLGNGETSIGVVFDRRLMDLHGSRDRAEAYEEFLRAKPALAEILEGAQMRREDLRSFSDLAYKTRQYMGEGWALMGDAAVFIDPYYSPGLDHAAFSVEATTEIVRMQLDETPIDERVAEHNASFLRSYDRFFESVYRDKYRFLDEIDLVTAAVMIETGQYYIFLVIPAYRFFGRFHWEPVLGPKPAYVSYHMMRVANRRFQKLAMLRRQMGEGGRRNRGRRYNLYFDLRFAPFRMVAKAMWIWLKAEVDGLRLLVKRAVAGAPRDTTSAQMAEER